MKNLKKNQSEGLENAEAFMRCPESRCKAMRDLLSAFIFGSDQELARELSSFRPSPLELAFFKNYLRLKLFRNSHQKKKINHILKLSDADFLARLPQLQVMVGHQRPNNATRSIFVKLLRMIKSQSPELSFEIPAQSLFSRQFYCQFLQEHGLSSRFLDLIAAESTRSKIIQQSQGQFLNNFQIQALTISLSPSQAKVRLGLIPPEVDAGFHQFRQMLG